MTPVRPPYLTHPAALSALFLIAAAAECAILSGVAHVAGFGVSPAAYVAIVLLGVGTAIHAACKAPRQSSARHPHNA
jgi:hypothetical protein